MPLRDFIDSDLIALNTRHATGAISTILLFGVTGWVAGKVISEGPLLKVIHTTEQIVVGACIIYLAVAILWELIQRFMRLAKGGGNAILVA